MKKIEDYDIGDALTIDKFNRESLLNVIKPGLMWIIDGQKIIENVIFKWLKVDDSIQSRNQLFYNMLKKSYTVSDQSVKSSLFENSFKVIQNFKDEHRAIVWKSLYRLIPESGIYRYRWHIISCHSSSNIPDLQYKEFKKSLIDNAVKEGKYGAIRLLLLSDKSLLTARHLPVLLENKNLFSELGDLVTNIKMPKNYSDKVESILLKTLATLSDNMDNNIDKKTNNALLEFLRVQIELYGESKNIGEFFLPIINTYSPQKLNLIQNSGLIQLLSHNKMNHELSTKNNKHKSFKL